MMTKEGKSVGRGREQWLRRNNTMTRERELKNVDRKEKECESPRRENKLM
jgi:hypothetical protein